MSHHSETDVVVVGSGAAGLTAALTAASLGSRVTVLEKLERVGGTTAVSGGVVWIPAHNRATEPDAYPISDAVEYLRSFEALRVNYEILDTFVESAGPMLDFVEEHTALTFSIVDGFPDYKPERPGGRPQGGRSFNPLPFDFDQLGDWAHRVYAFPSDWSDVGFDAETRARLHAEHGDGRGTGDLRVMGQALIGGLLHALLGMGVHVCVNSAASHLQIEDGRVVGVTFSEHDGEESTITARQGVILASGGFEWSGDLVRAFLRGPMSAPVSPPGHTGDGLAMSIEAGAQLANMSEAWWATAVKLPDDFLDGQVRSRSIRSERTRPGCIMVNRRGKRFANEAQDYNSMGGAFHQLDPETLTYPNSPSWMVFDDTHLRRYGFLGVRPDDEPPSWFHGSGTVRELAEKIGLDPEALDHTIGEWNHYVAIGETDPLFHRGASQYDQYWGDGELPEGPGRTLGVLQTAPFYAVQIQVGTIGTKGGPRTDGDARVLDQSGASIPGLYAAGNVSASVMGGAYPGAGATIAPAMVFGHRAGYHAAKGRSL